jgi:PIN domain nuclease of toxin-antitoxin system
MPNVRSDDLLVFDAYPLAAVLLDEPAAEIVTPLLSASLSESAVAAVTAAEVVDVVGRTTGARPEDIAAAVEWWVEGGLDVVSVDWRLARRAGGLRATHYHRSRMPVSLADCVAIVLAEELDGTLVTSDPPLLRLAGKIGVTVHPVPDTNSASS